MNIVTIRGFLLLLTGLLFLAGCSSTRVVTSWSDESYRSGRFTKPLILAMSPKQIIRAKLEDEFVHELRAVGIEAVQSYKLYPGQNDLTPETIKTRFSGNDRDSILVTHLMDVKKETVQVPERTDVYPTGGGYAVPAHYNSFGSYYQQSYSVVSSPAYSYEYKVYVLETNLYDTSSDKLAWTIVTETEEPDSIDAALKEFVRIVVKDMRKNKLLHETGGN